jgi:parallel beta-helix repeat protein
MILPRITVAASLVVFPACGDDGSSDSHDDAADDGGSSTATTIASGDSSGADEHGTTASPSGSDDGVDASDGTGADASSSGDDSGGDDGGDDGIGEWDEHPGVCPDGTTQVDLTTVEQLNAASRGEGDYAADGPGTCYFIHDGDYVGGEDPMLYIGHGGTADAPIYFVGESRDGVRLFGRATLWDQGHHVVLTNLTFDITDFPKDDAFNTVSVESVQDTTITHTTLTGDCETGVNGGHIESSGAIGLHVEACLIERFGRCGPEGHQEHGIYLAGGSDITIVNNVIRENASRGIQMYTQGGEYGTLDGITVERNRIVANGHADSEDGIVINATDTGTITDVGVRHNLIYGNYYSGIRFAGPATSAIVVEYNTFFGNGAGSSNDGRSEINIDEPGTAANAAIGHNIFAGGHSLINDCYDAAGMGFAIDDNVVDGALAGGDASCIGAVVAADPLFVDAAGADFHTANPDVAGYGAYAP